MYVIWKLWDIIFSCTRIIANNSGQMMLRSNVTLFQLWNDDVYKGRPLHIGYSYLFIVIHITNLIHSGNYLSSLGFNAS